MPGDTDYTPCGLEWDVDPSKLCLEEYWSTHFCYPDINMHPSDHRCLCGEVHSS